MTNCFASAAAWLASQRQLHSSESATYSRAGVEVSILGSPTPTDYDVVDGSGSTIRCQRWDWVVQRADLIFDEVATEPAEGDLIVRTVDGRSETYEVVPSGTAACFDVLDSDGKHFNVHTQLVGAV